MKRSKFLLIVCLFIFFPIIVNANSKLEVDNSNIEVLLNDTYEAEISLVLEDSIKGISFTMITTTYDIEPSFVTNYDDDVNNSTHSIIFNKDVSGSIILGKVILKTANSAKVGNSGNINLYNVTLTLTNGTTKLIGNLLLNVKVVSEVTLYNNEEESIYLSSIDSDIVDIELEKDKFDYVVYVNRELTTLDLEAIAEDENSLVSISNQNLNDDETIIEIVVTTKSGKEGKYSIKVIKENSIEKDNYLEDDVLTIEEDTLNNNNSGYKIRWIIIIAISIIGIIISSLFINKK